MIALSRNLLRLFIILMCLLSGCAGGGSSGTGTGGAGLTVTGLVLDDASSPIAGLTITVAATGDSAQTDGNGEFSISTEALQGDIQLLVEGPELSTAVIVPDVQEQSSAVAVDITVSGSGNSIAVKNLDVRAKIVGACDIYFENHAIIRQANSAPQGIRCTAKVWVRGDGRELVNVPVEVRYRGCDGGPWATLARELTLGAPHAGVAQLEFVFKDDEQHCVYGITAPLDVSGVRPVTVLVHTFTKQSRDR